VRRDIKIAAIDKEAFRRWRKRLRDLLNTEWDPIGGCPEDEYDGYGGTVAAMVRGGASDEELLVYLNWAETENMGLSGDKARLARVVALIRELGPVT
jgi:hypothetical protein